MTVFKVSSFCDGGGCVEVGQAPDGTVIIRDGRDESRLLEFTGVEWAAFVQGVKAGEFDPVV